MLSQFFQLLILYAPGARGDFLASMLLSRLANQTSWVMDSKLIKHDNILYKKAHYYEILMPESLTCTVNDLVKSMSIRIKLSSFSDCLTVAYYCKEKINPPMTFAEIFDKTIFHEIQHRKLDSFFNFVIDFNQLFDTNFLHQFYKDVINLPLTADDVLKLTQNIDKNPILTLNNYTNYIDAVDIDSLIQKYEQAFRVSPN